MAHEKEAQTTLAAQEGLGTITICGCDVVSLHLGAFSIRMERHVFARLEQLVTEAARELATRTLLPGPATNTLGPLIH